MWQVICNFFAGLFGKKNVRELAGVAATLIAANNPEKAAAVLVILKAALVMAKAGKLTDELFKNALAKISDTYKDNAIALAIAALATIPEIKTGEVNPDVIDILETIIRGIGG